MDAKIKYDNHDFGIIVVPVKKEKNKFFRGLERLFENAPIRGFKIIIRDLKIEISKKHYKPIIRTCSNHRTPKIKII